jgi:hypothetical protein
MSERSRSRDSSDVGALWKANGPACACLWAVICKFWADVGPARGRLSFVGTDHLFFLLSLNSGIELWPMNGCICVLLCVYTRKAGASLPRCKLPMTRCICVLLCVYTRKADALLPGRNL